MLKEKTFAGVTLPINYVEGPDNGPPLLLLHGITQRWQEFVQIIPALLDSYHVYGIDFRGHGKSGREKGSYHGEHYSQDVLEFIDQVIQSPVLVYGHSLGGMVSLYLSAHYPDRMRAQAIGDSIIFGADFAGTVLPGMFAQVHTMIANGFSYERLLAALPEMTLVSSIFSLVPMKSFSGCDDAYLSAWARSLSQLDPDVLRMTLDGTALTGYDPDGTIAEIKCPTLLIQADPKAGGLMTDNDVARIKAANPQVQVARMTGIGHPLHMYDAPPVIRALTNFLSALE